MNFIEIFKLSISNLLSYKTRTLLTMLGIIIGLASVVMISSLGEGFQSKLLSDISLVTETLVNVKVDTNYKEIDRSDLFDDDDINLIKSDKNVVSATFEYHGPTLVEKNTENFTYMLGIKNNDYYEVVQPEIVIGRWFSEYELKSLEEIVIIDRQSAVRLYGNENNAIGQKISLSLYADTNFYNYTIIGIFRSPGEDANDVLSGLAGNYIQLITPYKNVEILTGVVNKHDNMTVRIDKKENLATASKNIKLLLNNKKNRKNNKDIYKITLYSDELKKVTGVLDKISIFISLVASISIIVSGIGVMNIMLVSVKERITEIGLRKAIGAKNRDILIQFLIETVILTCLGGAIGVILGYSLAFIIGIFVKIIPILKLKVLLVSFTVSCLTGLVFGLHPAKQAAKLSPMEALRKD